MNLKLTFWRIYFSLKNENEEGEEEKEAVDNEQKDNNPIEE